MEIFFTKAIAIIRLIAVRFTQTRLAKYGVKLLQHTLQKGKLEGSWIGVSLPFIVTQMSKKYWRTLDIPVPRFGSQICQDD
jgi:hypothetical protein